MAIRHATFIDYNLPEKDVEFAVQTGRAVMLRNVRDGMEPRDGMISWDRRIRYLRKRGVNAPIYATAGITCGASLWRQNRLALRARLSEVA